MDFFNTIFPPKDKVSAKLDIEKKDGTPADKTVPKDWEKGIVTFSLPG
jgi:hypothetical protein